MNKQFSINELVTALGKPLAARDWFIVLVFFIVLFLMGVCYAGYLFLGLRAGTIVGSAEVMKPALPVVSRADLTRTVEEWRVRKANYEARNFSHPTLSNPAK